MILSCIDNTLIITCNYQVLSEVIKEQNMHSVEMKRLLLCKGRYNCYFSR